MKLVEIVNKIESLAIMSQMALSARDSFNLNNILITFENKVFLYNSEKKKLLDKYGVSENNENYTISKDNQPKYFKELCELDNIEVEDIDFKKLKLSFSKLENLVVRLGGIEPRHLYNVKDIIEFYDDIAD